MLKRKMSAYFTKRKYECLIVFTALCAGIVAGSFCALNNIPEATALFTQSDTSNIIISSFSGNVKFLGWIVLWGVNIFGAPVIIYLLYIKGASISAAICSLFMQSGSTDIMLILSILPYISCTIASIMFLSQGGLNCSFALFKSLWGKRFIKGTRENVMMLIAEFTLSALLTLLGGVCETICKVNIA